MLRLSTVLLLTALAAPAGAQPALRLVDPVVIVGGERLQAAGVVIDQPAFRYLDIVVPAGRFVVSDRPFTGARRAGDFDGEVLSFTVDGRSVRVRSAGPILSDPGLRPAYARFHASRAGTRSRGVQFYASGETPPAGGIRATGRGISDDPAVQAQAAANTRMGELDVERDRLEAELVRARAERDAAAAERRLRQSARPAAPPASVPPAGWNPGVPALAAERDALARELVRVRTERDVLRARLEAERAAPAGPASPATADEVARLRSELARAHAERRAAILSRDSLRAAAPRAAAGPRTTDAEAARAADRAAADVMALRTELDLMAEELTRIRAERDALRGGGPPAEPRRTGFDEPGGRLAISLPDFDHGRLQNVEEVRAEMAGTLLTPAALLGRSSGDVIVMFVTDTSGQVVQTAITEPVAPEVDAAAERIVGIMRIVPPQRNGRPAVLRSQVRVRFSR